jgi:hypothetical protein
MKAVLFLGAAVILGGAYYMHGGLREPNVYAMPVAEAYQRLGSVVIEPSGTGPFGRLDTVVTRDPPDTVVWTASGSHARYHCEISITPAEGNSSRIGLDCGGGGPSSGAAIRMERALVRKAVIEQIDATLEGRPYDPDRARGATAARWPSSGEDASLGSAVREAGEMEAQARRASAP